MAFFAMRSLFQSLNQLQLYWIKTFCIVMGKSHLHNAVNFHTYRVAEQTRQKKMSKNYTPQIQSLESP